MSQTLDVGAPVLLLASEGAGFMQPRVAPDGRTVAVTAPRYVGLWLVDVTAGTLQPVTDEPAAGFGFSWSADGEALLTRVARYEGPRRYNAVKVFNVASSSAQVLTEYRTMMPALPRWASDDAQVLLPQQQSVEVLDSGRAPDPSKAGAPTFVAFGSRIQMVSADANVSLQLLNAGLPDGDILNLTTSPDNRLLAFEVMGNNLFVMSADGSTLVDLGKGHRPQWSPDGQWVVFQRTLDDGYQHTSADLFAARVDGSGEVQLTDTPAQLEMNPHWSPDGRFIAYDAAGSIYLLPITQ